MDRTSSKSRTIQKRRRRVKRRARGVVFAIRIGQPTKPWRDLYHFLLTLPWSGFFAVLIGFYVFANAVFASLYLFDKAAIAGAETHTWLEAFFFSVETMATVGYGVQHPGTLYGHIVTTAEIVFGVMVMPLVTGLVIAKFSLPRASILFSRNAVIAPFEGTPTLMIRAANLRENQIIETRARMTLLRTQRSPEGIELRRLIDLPLLRESNPAFALGWTLMHPIDPQSPLAGMQSAELAAEGAMIMVVLTGIDGTTGANVYARHVYMATDIRFHHVFVDVLSRAEDGTPRIDYRHFHDIIPIAPSALRIGA
jgi:inward rectifier potassium channel